MRELIDRSNQTDQAIADGHGQPNDQTELEVMTDQQLQCAFQELSAKIETLRPLGAKLAVPERLAWEITLLEVMYRRELVQLEQIHRSLDRLDQSLAVQTDRQGAFSLSLLH